MCIADCHAAQRFEPRRLPLSASGALRDHYARRASGELPADAAGADWFPMLQGLAGCAYLSAAPGGAPYELRPTASNLAAAAGALLGQPGWTALSQLQAYWNAHVSGGVGSDGRSGGSGGSGGSGDGKGSVGGKGSGGSCGSGGKGSGVAPLTVAEDQRVSKCVCKKSSGRDEAGVRLQSAHEVAQATARERAGGSALQRELSNVGKAKDARERFKGWQRREGVYVLQRLEASMVVEMADENEGGEGGEGEDYDDDGDYASGLPPLDGLLVGSTPCTAEALITTETDTRPHTMDFATDLAGVGRTVSPRNALRQRRKSKDVAVDMDPMEC